MSSARIRRGAVVGLGAVVMLAASCFSGLEGEKEGKPAPFMGAGKEAHLSPCALAVTGDGETLYVACATAKQILVLDTSTAKTIRRIPVPATPSGLALSADGSRLYVTCAAPSSVVCVVDTRRGKVVGTLPAGHTAMSPVLSPDGKTLYVCNRFDHSVSAIDLTTGKEAFRVPVAREPVAAEITPDGRLLLVAEHLSAGRSDGEFVAAAVSVVDLAARKVIRRIFLPNGGTLARGLAISPDGRYAAVTHLLGRYHLPTTQVDRGWIQTNALSILDLRGLKRLNTVLLDNVHSGAANPWAVEWTRDGESIVVTHAGTHEVSIIDARALLEKLARAGSLSSDGSRGGDEVPNDLAFLVGIRQRIRLAGNGPRALALAGSRAYTANYFSDTLSRIDLEAKSPTASSIALGQRRAMSPARRGEMLFNDATLCFQGWLSCASCHSSDARVGGLNWDLLNDGIGNPKNVKSLLWAHQTPPTTSRGIRKNAEVSVRAGIRHILFTVRPEEDAEAIDEFLKSLTPMPSPYRVNGELSESAKRGETLFRDRKVGCARCHPPGLFTNLKIYNVGTRGKLDRSDRFDTPALVELWRTAPYLHDGSAVTVRDVVTTLNKNDRHGRTSHLSQDQINDLVTYVLSQ